MTVGGLLDLADIALDEGRISNATLPGEAVDRPVPFWPTDTTDAALEARAVMSLADRIRAVTSTDDVSDTMSLTSEEAPGVLCLASPSSASCLVCGGTIDTEGMGVDDAIQAGACWWAGHAACRAPLTDDEPLVRVPGQLPARSDLHTDDIPLDEASAHLVAATFGKALG